MKVVKFGFTPQPGADITLGIGNIYGPTAKYGVVYQMIMDEMYSRPGNQNPKGITIYGDGNQTRDFVYEDDVVAILAAVQEWEPGYYEFGTGVATSVFGVFRLLTFEWGYTPKLTYAPAREDENPAYEAPLRCDVKELMGIDWEPTSLEEGLKETARLSYRWE